MRRETDMAEPIHQEAIAEEDSAGQHTGVTLTDVAAQKARTLIEGEGRTDLALRVEVQPGGCSGLRYRLSFDDSRLPDDLVDSYDGVELLVDRLSAPYLGGAIIDFVDTIEPITYR